MGQAEQDNWLKIADQYLADPAFHERDDATSRYFRRIVELRREGRQSFTISDVADLHPRATGDVTNNVDTEISRLRRRIEEVAKKRGLQEITLMKPRGTGTYLIGLGTSEISYATRSCVFRIPLPFWSRALTSGMGIMLIALVTIIGIAIALAIVAGKGNLTSLKMALIASLAGTIGIAGWNLIRMTDRNFFALWPTQFYLKIEDETLMMERIWFSCPKCEAGGKDGMMTPSWDRAQQWVMRCRNNPMKHAAPFDYTTYVVDRFTE